ncbi:TetR/AcrR family transcriptional regulator|uniref:TetR/AcrR family transcriptional regulator n=1 Tax=Pseudomonas sp. SbOxS1 TaxID=2723884 RepID=UPI0015D45899|nr:TetR/AcrR family transcriptional regulator [Pseudomonas sp. SbOxS1]NYU04726.1 TetR/AcrR family transcriptional regulator [Pseudomonas sp. SbOxS1]
MNGMSHSLLTGAIDQVHPSRYLQTRQKALELFARSGFSRVSMRDLAAYLGIKVGSIYNHIDSKEALLFELIEELYEQLLHGASLVNRRKSAPAVRLHALLEAHLLLHERMGAHFRLAEHDLHCLDSEQHASILALRRRYEDHLVTTIEQLTGTPASVSLRSTLSGIVSLLNQLPAWIAESPASKGARRKLLHDMVMGALQGALQATPSGGSRFQAAVPRAS